jgi:hypothetical protein
LSLTKRGIQKWIMEFMWKLTGYNKVRKDTRSIRKEAIHFSRIEKDLAQGTQLYRLQQSYWTGHIFKWPE